MIDGGGVEKKLVVQVGRAGPGMGGMDGSWMDGDG
jgi:hypothetical protein